MNVRPARVRQSGQSLILDSKQGIPDSRYWISHSTCPLAGFRIPKPRISDFSSKNYPGSGVRTTSHQWGENEIP